MKALHWLDENFEQTVSIILFMLFAGIMVLNVFMRFLINNAIPWASEIVLFISTWFIMFAMSYGFKENAHVKVTFITGLFPEKVQVYLALVCDLAVLAMFIVLVINGTALLTDISILGKTGLLVKYPMWSLYLALPVGSALSAFRIVQNFYNEVKKLKEV